MAQRSTRGGHGHALRWAAVVVGLVLLAHATGGLLSLVVAVLAAGVAAAMVADTVLEVGADVVPARPPRMTAPDGRRRPAA